VTAGGTATVAPPPVDEPAPAPADDDAARISSMHEVPTAWGPTGLLHLPSAMTGAAGTFRVAMYLDWFSTSGFLCTADNKCPWSRDAAIAKGEADDEHSHIGSSLVIGATLTEGLEAYGAARVYANSNTASSPKLLQVLGDTTLGLKYARPIGTGVVNLGAAAEVLFLNGTGGIGLSGGGTSFRLRGLSTFALDKGESKTPLRFHVGLGYLFDNSGVLVDEVETARSDRTGKREVITRQERYGLGINRLDRFEIGLGAEALLADDLVRPFAEWNIGIPVNRQGFECVTPGSPRGGNTWDGCLGLAEGYVPPSKLTLGVRAFPFKAALSGLNFTAAGDIGTSGVRTFISEVAPQAPWTLWLGIGLTADAVEKAPKTVEKIVEKKVEVAGAPNLVKVRGLVHETGSNAPVPNAIVSYVGTTGMPPLATGADGVFGDDVAPGTYQFSIKAEGYKDGTCGGTAVAAPKPGEGTAPAGTPPGGPLPPTPGVAPKVVTPGLLEVDCALEALPKVGSANLTIVDADSQSPVSGVQVTIADINGGGERVLTTDANGRFKVDGLAPGTWTVKVAAEGYFATKQQFEVRVREESKDKIGIRLRPKDKLVTVDKGEIKIKQQVHFAVDKAVILGDSVALLEEVADALISTPRIKKIEIQGHTDNSGTKEHNQELSQSRADAVKAFLVKAGVDAGRLDAKGYGQTKPIAPNINEAGKSKNRRVQFLIIDQDPAPADAKKPK
jgi:outer membrane protein OmpA-like peptidoglycan-associated protein